MRRAAPCRTFFAPLSHACRMIELDDTIRRIRFTSMVLVKTSPLGCFRFAAALSPSLSHAWKTQSTQQPTTDNPPPPIMCSLSVRTHELEECLPKNPRIFPAQDARPSVPSCRRGQIGEPLRSPLTPGQSFSVAPDWPRCHCSVTAQLRAPNPGLWHSRPGCVRPEVEIQSTSAQDSRGRLSHIDATSVRGPTACPAYERTNFQSFCNELCDLLAVPRRWSRPPARARQCLRLRQNPLVRRRRRQTQS